MQQARRDVIARLIRELKAKQKDDPSIRTWKYRTHRAVHHITEKDGYYHIKSIGFFGQRYESEVKK